MALASRQKETSSIPSKETSGMKRARGCRPSSIAHRLVLEIQVAARRSAGATGRRLRLGRAFCCRCKHTERPHQQGLDGESERSARERARVCGSLRRGSASRHQHAHAPHVPDSPARRARAQEQRQRRNAPGLPGLGGHPLGRRVKVEVLAGSGSNLIWSRGSNPVETSVPWPRKTCRRGEFATAPRPPPSVVVGCCSSSSSVGQRSHSSRSTVRPARSSTCQEPCSPFPRAKRPSDSMVSESFQLKCEASQSPTTSNPKAADCCLTSAEGATLGRPVHLYLIMTWSATWSTTLRARKYVRQERSHRQGQ